MSQSDKASVWVALFLATFFASFLVHTLTAQAEPVGNSPLKAARGTPDSLSPLPQQPPRQPSLAELRARLSEEDRIAALRALQKALSELSDGATYVWGRPTVRLRGLITPTASFRASDGRICRHVIYTLSLGRYLRRIEGVACRLKSGIWSLEG